MAKKPYRVEVSYPSKGKPKYFLVKDVKVRGKKRKVTKYLGSGNPPSPEELKKFRETYAYDIEAKAARKKAELSAPLFQSDYLTTSELTKLEELRFIFQRFNELLTVNEAEAYEKNFEVSYISGTTSIEGNTLTLDQTKGLLFSGLAPKDKTLREINEIQNFRKVIIYRKKYRGKITLDFIRHLHALIMDNIDTESAGTFRRTDDVVIGNCPIDLAPAIMIEEELTKAINDYYAFLGSEMHPFEAAVLFHYSFEVVHPFADGNGRVGREIFNCMLTRERFPRLLFLGKDRELYIDALQLGNKGEYGRMVSTLASLILSQRSDILSNNLKRVVVPPQKKGQLRLTDFD